MSALFAKFKGDSKDDSAHVAESSAFEKDAETTVVPQDHESHEHASHGHVSDSDEDSIDKKAQTGVQDMEATTKIWTFSNLVIAYVMIWLIYFIDSMQSGATNSLTPYVTSSFSQHSLTATTSILSSIIGGLTKLPLAKIVDVWGRPQGFLLMIFILTVGIVMMAGCNNVKTYAAAQVFYWVGFNGVGYCLSIFIADTSSLKNRSLMLAFASSPYIATTWIGGPMANAILKGPGWRWGFGIFSIVTPAVTLPLYALFTYNHMKAKKAGLAPKRNSGRTLAQSLKHYAIEFDLAGLMLLITGFSLFLLSFALYSYQKDQWKSPLIICFIIFGVLLLIGFGLYEKYLAPKTFIPFEILVDRSVLGASILSGVLFVSFYIWDSYFISFLQVVNGLSVTEASYVANIYSIGSCFWSIVVGGLIRWSGRYKWLGLYFGLPLNVLGIALMIPFRSADSKIGLIVMCQIFIAFAGGTLVIVEQMAAMAAVTHQHVAVVLAIEGMFANVGGAIGQAIASAVWTGVFPVRLAEYLPESSKADALTIYGDIETQLSYPMGSPERIAIQMAYADAQRYMLIGGTAILALGFPAIMVWRDIKVKDFKQTKGLVV
ncbi:MFS general substrate transporter [Eremomyces bilateralis CBS 781.70]|uniref:MFS general substrate transporter n=1 Tax=Eremomyces bilateralis CBS 781.70 TaxID=1392243 RepID=A0A6G1GA96_9PEZI|nr:MFS general substrate transporter [Eremomyces bilateralis CBS 781.70]KAF1814759.1 MFS general substrate transporter [Eremomyces bilateralis CBS 781.70]